MLACAIWPVTTAADAAVVRVSASIVSIATVEVDGPFARALVFGAQPEDVFAFVGGVDVGRESDAWVAVGPAAEALAWSD